MSTTATEQPFTVETVEQEEELLRLLVESAERTEEIAIDQERLRLGYF